MIKPTAFGWSIFACIFAVAVVPIVGHALALETDLQTQALQGLAVSSPTPKAPLQWHSTRATFYGNPYDSHPSRYRCADGTPYRSDGAFCATRLVPIGTVIEVKRGSKVLRLVVRDTQAKRFGHLIDIPSKTWDKFGAKRSIGMLPVQWRVVQ